MSYRAKRPRKKRLRSVIGRCYRVSVVDENDDELCEDLCFLPREEAKQDGERMKRDLLERMEGYE